MVQKWIISSGLVVSFFTICLAIKQDVKTWNPTTNFLNPRNWENGQLPCANDRIIFPSNSPVITMMPQSVVVKEMILPLNGEVIFPQNAVIELTGENREGACTGKDVHFKKLTDYWYDPINWNITSDQAFPRSPNRRNAAVPHCLLVPCVTDKVRFAENTTFQAYVIYPITKVASMEINGISYSQSEFDDLLRTHVGSLLFPENPRIHITNSPCADESGCICGNDGPEVKPTICNEVTPYCPALECSDPITPVGNCCPICGVQMVMKHKENFKLDTLMTLYSSFLNKEEYKEVESFTAKTFEGDIQSVFLDGSQYKGLASKVASKIYDELVADMGGAKLYKIQSITTVGKSEAWNSGVPTYEHVSGGMSSGGVAALVVILIVALGLGVAFYVYRKRHIPGFNFARFDVRGDKFELELGTTPHDELQPVDTPEASSSTEEKGKGFDNPVYGTSVEAVAPATEESPVMKDFVENPMFMIFEDTSEHDSKDKE